MAFGNYAYNPYMAFVPQNYGQMPQAPTQIQQMPQNIGLNWVAGAEEANNYIVAPNNAVTLWDRNGKYVYLKSADATGLATMQTYRLIKEKSAQENAEEKEQIFTPLSDFEALQAKFEALEERINDISAKKRKKESENDEQ